MVSRLTAVSSQYLIHFLKSLQTLRDNLKDKIKALPVFGGAIYVLKNYNSYLDFFLLISFIYAAVMMPEGRAMTATPTRADIIVIIRPT